MTAISGDIEEEYQKAIKALLEALEEFKLSTTTTGQENRRENNLTSVEEGLKNINISVDMLDKLSVIHVAGTKGKGSTCAFTESILRHHGFRTGFYSSPHLKKVRERIRLNGLPISTEIFLNYFWCVFNALFKSKKDVEKWIPGYFQFFTILAFKVFLEEKVDVVILEVGIGGENDCTNVIKKPIVCGITSLGLDHVMVLGNSVEEIASKKAGIIKIGSICLTVTDQPGDSQQVIIDKALTKMSPLYLVSSLDFPSDLNLGLCYRVQTVNASLAVQLARIWIRDHKKDYESRVRENESFLSGESQIAFTPPTICVKDLSHEEIRGLELTRWPGRFDMEQRGSVIYYLDGAHTKDSLKFCADWFRLCVNDNGFFKVLLFNATGNRDIKSLLEKLSPVGFHEVIFTPNRAKLDNSPTDNVGVGESHENMLERCLSNQTLWNEMIHPHKCETSLVDCIDMAIEYIEKKLANQNRELAVRVLVTGSLHLVGSTFEILRPALYAD